MIAALLLASVLATCPPPMAEVQTTNTRVDGVWHHRLPDPCDEPIAGTGCRWHWYYHVTHWRSVNTDESVGTAVRKVEMVCE